MPAPFHTIGHSDRSIAEFLEILRAHRIEQVIDVRKLPGSRKHPHFDEGALAASLDEVGIRYLRLEPLTGRRPVSREVAFSVNALWRNRSFHNYADWALGEEFQAGLAELRAIGAGMRVAVMCAEAVWWRCHRRIIADHLLANGEEVVHIMGQDRADAARLTEGARTHPDGTVTYPA